MAKAIEHSAFCLYSHLDDLCLVLYWTSDEGLDGRYTDVEYK